MSILRNGHVAMSNLGVEGHLVTCRVLYAIKYNGPALTLCYSCHADVTVSDIPMT